MCFVSRNQIMTSVRSRVGSSSSSASSSFEDLERGSHGRYKTELCHSFTESGECKYGVRCQFAHGVHEIRRITRHPKHKTVLCRSFHETGFCGYGARCNFIHSGEDVIILRGSSGTSSPTSSCASSPRSTFSATGSCLSCFDLPPPPHVMDEDNARLLKALAEMLAL